MNCKVISEWLKTVSVRMPRHSLGLIREAREVCTDKAKDANVRAIHCYTEHSIIPFMLQVCGLKRFNTSSELFESSWDASTNYYCQMPHVLDEAGMAMNQLETAEAIIDTHPIRAITCLGHAYTHARAAAWDATAEVDCGTLRARVSDMFDAMIVELFDVVLAREL